jgi:CubicO group peptidase (beta-lactamase class C family)
MQTTSPEHVGVSTERLAYLDAALQRYVDQGKVAGIVTMLSRRGHIFHAKGYGVRDLSTGRPMQPDTLVRLWSVTKVITAVATLMCYERGGFVLDQPVADFIPAFGSTAVYARMDGDKPLLVDQERPITIRHLLTHTGGVASGFGGAGGPPEELMRSKIETLRVSNPSLADIVEGIAQVPLIAQPNTLWRYGQSFEILARLVEIVSGQSFANFLQTHIFDPLGMIDTSHAVRADQLERFSAFYTTGEDGHLALIEASPRSIHYLPNKVIPPAAWTPGGYGLVSTAPDIQRLGNMLLNRGMLDNVRILAPTTVDLMTTNHLPPALIPYHFPGAQPMYGYGHGLGVHTLIDHGLAGTPCANGEYWKDGGSGTLLWVDPRYELVGTVCYQLDPFWIHPIFAATKALTYQALDPM